MDPEDFFNPKLFDGEVAVVTGGASGIGLRIARALTARGAEVMITSRSIERLEAAELEIAARTGRIVSSLPCDVREADDVDRLQDFVMSRFGGASIVVNNAAANFFTPAERMTRRAFDTVVQADLYGTFAVTQAFVGHMIEQRHGNILNITIVQPERGFPGFSHSGAAKAGILSLTCSWAFEWGRHGIRVNGIAPGPVPTRGVAENMLATDSPFADDARHVPLGRLGTPEDITSAALFLLSPAASWITGVNLVVDGGLFLNPPVTDS
ncbi:SDR family oxidoreductase [Paractinoplanes rhizophilus]|jgi:NAD(P)-dependent dehydrogenase (short-subunit alcohol dehydrogenase family)|uniref:Peroxisomal trans-2-enoyl-CoA reductase n=1 Tax=Paractinoplanes rhizophilus TaxID=1416877 RepID=A0ABW2HRU3_9ACTN